MKKRIEKEDWVNRFTSITSGNSGRKSTLKHGEKHLAENRAFQSIDFDPEGKGNAVYVQVDGYGHTIDKPSAVAIEQSDAGVLKEIEISGSDGSVTHLQFE